MGNSEENIRRMRLPRWAMNVLLRGNPREINAAGIHGIDADAAMPAEQLMALEHAGFKVPGRPMTVTQMAEALLAGLIPEDTQIVRIDER